MENYSPSLCREIYPGVICEASPELTLAICVQRFTFFLYIEIFLFVKISEVHLLNGRGYLPVHVLVNILYRTTRSLTSLALSLPLTRS